MKHIPIYAPALIVLLLSSGCGTRQSETTNRTERDSIQTTRIYGKWVIENVVCNDSVYARPSEVTPGIEQYATFTKEGEYIFNTNCNTLQGPFTVKGDSITLSDGLITEMACDNEEVENLLCRILPHIKTIDIENDSIARLDSEGEGYILLKRNDEQ